MALCVCCVVALGDIGGQNSRRSSELFILNCLETNTRIGGHEDASQRYNASSLPQAKGSRGGEWRLKCVFS